jgi:polyphosphate kinase
MSQKPRTGPLNWNQLSAEQVVDLLIKELYSPVSILGAQLKRLTDDDDPISEEEYEEIFAHMHHAVNQLSTTVVHLKRYSEEQKRTEG